MNSTFFFNVALRLYRNNYRYKRIVQFEINFTVYNLLNYFLTFTFFKYIFKSMHKQTHLELVIGFYCENKDVSLPAYYINWTARFCKALRHFPRDN